MDFRCIVRVSASRILWFGVVMLLPSALSTGCASPGRSGDLPLGAWAGRGSFVYEVWEAGDGAEVGSIARGYPTQLTLRPARVDGHEVIEMEIRSQRGHVPVKDFGDETHIVAALVKGKRVSDSIVLYRLAGLLYNPAPHERLHLEEKSARFSASCTTSGGATLLQLRYSDGFVDNFRFQDGRVEKSGMCWTNEKGLIHWVEELSPVQR